MTPDVSVLVPVYNVSSYIERCAHSLFSQTFKNVEFIFVDDCTPDDSIEKLLKVIEEYPERKNQIRIIHHDINRGLAAARNTAIDASNGEYISVVDSDDFVEHTMIDTLYNKAKSEDADIVVSDLFIEQINESVLKIDALSKNSEDYFPDMIRNITCHSYLWNKLIKKSLYVREDCRVPNGLNYYEDRHVMTRLFFYAKKIVKVNEAFYHYVQYNTNSITKRIIRMNFQNMIDFWELLGEFLIEKNMYNIYAPIMEYPKAQSKVHIMSNCGSYKLLKEYAEIFSKEELKYISNFKFGEKVIMFFIRKKLFILAILTQKAIFLKNSFSIKNGKIKINKILLSQVIEFS